MQVIHTTATAVEKFKSRAKALSREEDIPHMVALERVAREAGYEDWHHVLWCHAQRDVTNPSSDAIKAAYCARVQGHLDFLASNRAPVIGHSVKGDVFHDVTIGGIRFKGYVSLSGDPSICCVSALYPEGEHFVQLGAASIRHCQIDPKVDNKSWWICKYGPDEARIDVDAMTPEGRNALAFEFGLPIVPDEDDKSGQYSSGEMFRFGNEGRLFYLSPAFKSLCLWAGKHVRKTHSFKNGNGHLKDWSEAALKGLNPFPES